MTSEPASALTAGAQMARWSTKALLVTAGVALVAGAVWYARAATVPIIVAALVSTQLIPLIGWMVSHRMSRGLAIALSLVGVVLAAIGLTWLFADALFSELDGVGAGVSQGADKVVNWLADNTDWVADHEEDIREFLAGLLPAAKGAAGGVLGAALGGLALAAQLISSALLTLVFLLYILTSGESVWQWIMERFRPERRTRVGVAGAAAWRAAGGYIRGIALVAFIDSAIIGIGMLIIGTPHAGTLVLLSFVCLFIPILGAWVSGTVIVLITLADQGSGAALAMAIVILVGQQLDSMFVTPLVYQQTVNLHPIVTLGGVIVGTQLMGIIGAFLTVPMIAVGWAVWRSLEQTGEPDREAEEPWPQPAPAGQPTVVA
jgi:predicted PurR-regulated permease PerM